MSGRKLKNYDEYLQKVKMFAKVIDVKIRRKHIASDGEYVPSLRSINIDKELTNSNEIAALLHELGHSQDDTLLNKTYYAKLNKAYIAVYKRKETPAQLDLVIECEERAWLYARSVAKQLRIPLGKWFDNYKKLCIKNYKEES